MPNGLFKTLTLRWDGANLNDWHVVSSPNPANAFNNQLYGVAMRSANDVWAVGQYGPPYRTLAMHWDGSAWTAVLTPNGSTTGNNYLLGVAMVSASDVWAVGYYRDTTLNADRNLVLRWNGSSWSVVSSPNVGNLNNGLAAVSAVSANDVWAVGNYVDQTVGTYRTLTLHWNGSSWSVVSSPNVGNGNNFLGGVSALSANDVWAVGYYRDTTLNANRTLVLHWNGSSWSVVPSSNQGNADNGFSSVTRISPVYAFAAGNYYSSTTNSYRTLTDILNLAMIPSQNQGNADNLLYGTAGYGMASSGGSVWSVGSYHDTFLNADQPLILNHACIQMNTPTNTPTNTPAPTNTPTRTNTPAPTNTPTRTNTPAPTSTFTPTPTPAPCSWRIVSSPNVGNGNNYLLGVDALSASDVWAVGYYRDTTLNADRNLILHWDGSSWSVVTSPNVGNSHNGLAAVSAVSANDVWAVGNYAGSGGSRVTLTLHWDGSSWSVVSSPNVTNIGENYLNGVGALSANDVWAVGYYFDPFPGQIGTLVEHWNGSNWSIVSSPNPSPFSILYGVSALSASDVWAVGYYASGSDHTLTLHWDGSSWSVVSSPNVGNGNNYLLGVDALSASDVWAVGYYRDLPTNTNRTLTLHWDGSSWSVVFSLSQGSSDNGLAGVSAVGVNDVWAVGNYQDTSLNATRTLTERYSCIIPTPTPGGPSPTPTPCTIQFSDVPSNHPFYIYIRCLACRGIIGGYSDGTFRPGNPTTRGQMSKIVANAAGILDPIPPNQQSFTDVPPSHPFWVYIERLALHGIVGGYSDGTFRPDNWVTRGQLTKFASNAAGFNEPIPPGTQTYTDVPPTQTFWVYIERLSSRGVISGYQCGVPPAGPCDPQNRPYFLPDATVTRGQTSKIVANTFYPNCQTP
jgi:hypothetical protein